MSRRPTAALGLAGAACVACCAGSLLAATGGVAALGAVLGAALFGALALAVAVIVVAGVLALARRRHRQAAACGSDGLSAAEPTPVSLGPTARSG